MRNMKLSVKMGLGFGVMILIAAILSIAGWYFLGRVERVVLLSDAADEAYSKWKWYAARKRTLLFAF